MDYVAQNENCLVRHFFISPDATIRGADSTKERWRKTWTRRPMETSREQENAEIARRARERLVVPGPGAIYATRGRASQSRKVMRLGCCLFSVRMSASFKEL
jgi:hypothetical protein